MRGKLSASLWVFPGVWFLAPICLRSACMQSKSWWVLVARNLSESVKNHYAAQPPFPNPCMPHGSQMEACDQTRHSTTRRLAVSVSATKYRLCYVRLAERVSLSHSCLLALSLSLLGLGTCQSPRHMSPPNFLIVTWGVTDEHIASIDLSHIMYDSEEGSPYPLV